MTDEEFERRFEAAKNICFAGHEAGCTYGGMAPGTGYWLAVDGCDLAHGDEPCATCGGEATTSIRGWHTDGYMIWYVALCQPCTDRKLAIEAAKPQPPPLVCPACGLTSEEFTRQQHSLTIVDGVDGDVIVRCEPSGATAPLPGDYDGVLNIAAVNRADALVEAWDAVEHALLYGFKDHNLSEADTSNISGILSTLEDPLDIQRFPEQGKREDS